MYAPHGGVAITHSPLCFGDCGHWDCMGCCGCPSDQVDVDTVAMLTERDSREWLAEWYRGEIADARHGALEEAREAIREHYRVAPKAALTLLERIDALEGPR